MALPARPDIHQVLAACRGQHHLVVMQAYPDPDAIASAFAHRLLSAWYDIETTLLYTGKISHSQNAALVKLLGLDLTPYTPGLDLAGYAGAVFVDNQGTTSDEIARALEAAGVPALLVVDHHDPQERLKPAYSDIQRVGATATLYAGYLEHGPLELDKAQRDHRAVATALLHGLITDTGGFVRAGAEDFCAARFLSQFRDADLLDQIMHQARPKQAMEVIRQALGNRLVVESFSIAGVGYLRAADRDAIPQAADFLMTEENVHTAIVYGIVIGDDQKETVVGSLRTAKLTLSPDDFLKEVLGRNADGRPYGGGKAAAGGFEVPIGFLSGDHGSDYRDLKWRVFDAQIKHRLLSKIGVEHHPPA
ncbi:MAG: DHH family phosphoesterase [Anaerolineales bacterium]|nr:DHH family phosphoesterase [Anaerolineales bacterium]